MTEQLPPEPHTPEPWEMIADALRRNAGHLVMPAQADDIARALADGGWRIVRENAVLSQPAALGVEILAEALHAQYRLQRPGGKPMSDSVVRAMAAYIASQYDRLAAEREATRRRASARLPVHHENALKSRDEFTRKVWLAEELGATSLHRRRSVSLHGVGRDRQDSRSLRSHLPQLRDQVQAVAVGETHVQEDDVMRCRGG